MSKNISQRHSSVEDMLQSILPDEKELHEELHDQQMRRQLVPRLAALRNHKAISQERVAEVLDCGQSRISKLENGYDSDITVGDLIGYARAANCNLSIVFESAEMNLVDKVKHHASCISNCFEKMNELAQVDSEIKSGVAKFHLEALVNLVDIVARANKTLHQHAQHVFSSPTVSLQLRDVATAFKNEETAQFLGCDFSNFCNLESPNRFATKSMSPFSMDARRTCPRETTATSMLRLRSQFRPVE